MTVRNSIHKYVFTLKKHPSVGPGSIAFSLPQVGEAAADTLFPTNSPFLELSCSLLAVVLLCLSHSVCHCLVFVHLPSLCLLSILKLGSHSGTKVVLSPPPDALTLCFIIKKDSADKCFIDFLLIFPPNP